MPENKNDQRMYTSEEVSAILKQLVEKVLSDEAKRIQQAIASNLCSFTHIELKAAFNETATLYQGLMHEIDANKNSNFKS